PTKRASNSEKKFAARRATVACGYPLPALPARQGGGSLFQGVALEFQVADLAAQAALVEHEVGHLPGLQVRWRGQLGQAAGVRASACQRQMGPERPRLRLHPGPPAGLLQGRRQAGAGLDITLDAEPDDSGC